MEKLNTEQVNDRVCFIHEYIKAFNAASGSEVDANSNVTNKTMATMEAELYKQFTISLNRKLITDELRDIYSGDGECLEAKQYLDDLKNHRIYVHDETSLKPYCSSITLYPYLLKGTKVMGGVSKAPKNLQSFCGSFVNLVYQVASNFAGAVATVEFLAYFDYFARKTYGVDYLKTHKKEVAQEMQGVVYALNQPASARGDQSVFWNISCFDRPYMREMFDSFYFPDGTQVNFETLYDLQVFFMDWFREERTKELLTFPVLTCSLLTTDTGFADEKFKNLCAEEMSKGLSFFVYMSDKVDSLASCCRLRNELADNTFSYSLGAGGVVTGSAQVITLNINRIAQEAGSIEEFFKVLPTHIMNVQTYLIAHRNVYKRFIDAGMLPAYSAGFMSLDKQFLTLGLNGVVEAAEFFGFQISPDDEGYTQFLIRLLSEFKRINKGGYEVYGTRFNTEFVPAENLGVKNAKWDKEQGFKVNRDCYNSYFYVVEDDSTILDKIRLYNSVITSNLDGGSALHLNLQQLPDASTASHLFDLCRKNGVPYWTFNVLSTICKSCGKIDPDFRRVCKHCSSENVEYATRIIGYLKRISDFSEARQKEAGLRFYHKN